MAKANDDSSAGGFINVDGQQVPYIYLRYEIDFDTLGFQDKDYENSEQTILTPALQSIGFDSVTWGPLDDGLGPDVRLAKAVTNVENGEDQAHYFVYIVKRKDNH